MKDPTHEVELSSYDMLFMIYNLFIHDMIHDMWPASQQS